MLVVVLDAFPPDVVLAEADLALQAGVLPQPVAALTLQSFLFHDLTTGLMFELIILAQISVAEAALEDSPSVIPHIPLTLCASGILERACAGVSLQTLLSVADPGLAEITDSSHHLHSSRVLPWMSYDAIPCTHHTLLLPTGSADW